MADILLILCPTLLVAAFLLFKSLRVKSTHSKNQPKERQKKNAGQKSTEASRATSREEPTLQAQQEPEPEVREKIDAPKDSTRIHAPKRARGKSTAATTPKLRGAEPPLSSNT